MSVGCQSWSIAGALILHAGQWKAIRVMPRWSDSVGCQCQLLLAAGSQSSEVWSGGRLNKPRPLPPPRP
eukprot:7075382-Lingulodinium_polyedra.AAC.1